MEHLLASSPLASYFYRLASAKHDFLPENDALIEAYTTEYLSHSGLDIQQAYAIYEGFIKTYTADLQTFSRTGEYPWGCPGNRPSRL